MVPEGQLQASGTLVSPESIKSEGRVMVRVRFEEDLSRFQGGRAAPAHMKHGGTSICRRQEAEENPEDEKAFEFDRERFWFSRPTVSARCRVLTQRRILWGAYRKDGTWQKPPPPCLAAYC